MQRDPIFESRCKITLLCFYKMKGGEFILLFRLNLTLFQGTYKYHHSY